MNSINELNFSEYNKYTIKKGKESYILKIEIIPEYIYFITKALNNKLNYIYRNKIKITSLIDKLNLDKKYNSCPKLFLEMFDELYKSNHIFINKKKSNLNLQFESLDNIKFEITLFIENMTIDDKLNMIYDEIISKKSNKFIIENAIKFEYLNNKNCRESCINKVVKKEKNLKEIKAQEDRNNYEIKELLDSHQKYLENLKEEFYEFKNNIEKKMNEYLSNISKEVENSLRETKISNIPCNNNHEKKNYIKIKYKIDNEDKTKIFGTTFVKNNVNKLKIIFNNQEYKLSEFFHVDNINKINYFEIELKKINNDILDLKYMFRYCNSLISITNWNAFNVTDFSYMFYECSSIPDISNWNTSKVTDMSYMFYKCKSIPNISNWDTSNVINMSYMFNECSSIPDISNWNTSKVIDMSYMFYKCKSIPNISEWDTSNVTDMSNMFCNCESIPNISKWDTTNVTNMIYMFYKCKSIPNISIWNTSNVTNLAYMFYECDSIPDISDWNTSKVINMSYMFYRCKYICNISKWNTSNVTNMSYMFAECNIIPVISKWILVM